MTETPITGRVGFIGLGVMGQPMALNLARAGTDLVVWNRTPERARPLAAAGARIARSVDEVFEHAQTVMVMLVNEQVTDDVLGRGAEGFAPRVAGRLIISTGSVGPAYSRRLAADVRAAGGSFVESPVSGSRGPAEAGTLVALLGGERAEVEQARSLLGPITRETIWCGPIGNGLLMKLAVNHYLNVMLAALAEATHFADSYGLDRTLLEQAIMAGPMASELAGVKLRQLVQGDYAVRAAASDAHASTRLIVDAARDAGISTPLLDLASDLYAETVSLGHGRSDMIAVLEAVQARTATGPQRPGPQSLSRHEACPG